MSIGLEEYYKKNFIGLINTYIRMVNESDKYDYIGKGIINNEWKSQIKDNGDTFVAILTVNGREKYLNFEEYEWKTKNPNIYVKLRFGELL
ncbi:hypothetical protein [Paenibacillus sp. Soil724D2]|uniref:hypothetical protein n=1 Tax=Paenibacillus sp. (strain Soil724D2) TaxID=1736392 RepID=UPI0007132A22|nr:hypothetical protein [Paenibacillus sp. Soil724D2]KRE48403.1 hypothetical protein ASG85_05210 [Paenibacillus sp. Soil724D2]